MWKYGEAYWRQHRPSQLYESADKPISNFPRADGFCQVICAALPKSGAIERGMNYCRACWAACSSAVTLPNPERLQDLSLEPTDRHLLTC